MKIYFIKMMLVVLIITSFTNIYIKKNEQKVLITNIVENKLAYNSIIPENIYFEEVVYEDLTLNELGIKIDTMFSSSLSGYGQKVASIALEKEVDPIVAASIILVETGCQSNCSKLVKSCNNVGGMKGKGGCGSYAKFNSLELGIEAFINNLSKNYYKKGLNTPELINKKYATNPNWHKNVNYYVKLIKAS